MDAIKKLEEYGERLKALEEANAALIKSLKVVKGDMNGDGRVDASDLSLLIKEIMNS